MLMVAMKGLAGSGKSTLARMLSSELGWPLIDKDDIKDVVEGKSTDPGGLSYEAMFRIAQRQLRQNLNVICDSPLQFEFLYLRAKQVATEVQAKLVIIECVCSDEQVWKERINARKLLNLPPHHQTDWETFNIQRTKLQLKAQYPIEDDYLLLDTIQSQSDVFKSALNWLHQKT